MKKYVIYLICFYSSVHFLPDCTFNKYAKVSDTKISGQRTKETVCLTIEIKIIELITPTKLIEMAHYAVNLGNRVFPFYWCQASSQTGKSQIKCHRPERASLV